MQPICLEITSRPISNSLFRAINLGLSNVGRIAERVEGNDQLLRIEVSHELDVMGVVDELEDMEIDGAIYEGYPKEDLSNKYILQ